MTANGTGHVANGILAQCTWLAERLDGRGTVGKLQLLSQKMEADKDTAVVVESFRGKVQVVAAVKTVWHKLSGASEPVGPPPRLEFELEFDEGELEEVPVEQGEVLPNNPTDSTQAAKHYYDKFDGYEGVFLGAASHLRAFTLLVFGLKSFCQRALFCSGVSVRKWHESPNLHGWLAHRGVLHRQEHGSRPALATRAPTCEI